MFALRRFWLGTATSAHAITTAARPAKQDDLESPMRFGHTKIRDALRGLKIEIGRTTVANTLAEEGMDPAPERKKISTWAHFLKSHWETL